MASIISAGTTDATSLNVSGDKTGILQLASNNAVTAVTIDASQNVGIGTTSPAAFGGTNLQVQNSTLASVLWSNGTITGQLLCSSGAEVTVGSRSNHPLRFGTNDTERMRIDTSGNVGIGTTSTSAKLSVSVGGVSTLGQQSNQALALLGGGSNNQLCQIGMGYGTGATYTPTAIGSITTTQTGYTIADLIFATRSVNTDTAPTERMRIDSSGNVLVGTTGASPLDSGRLRVYNSDSQDAVKVYQASAGATCLWNRLDSTSGYFAVWRYGASTTVGTITTNGTGVTYGTSSDYRLKENVQPMTGALEKVSQLKPVTYTWKSNNSEGQGFIAHELQEVVPDAVQGKKDAVDDDGNPVYQGIDTSFLVATLTAAIQELKAINDTQAETINALTARLEALENK
jgi:hypothetical protein